jgi:hypothetical protein
MMRKARLAIRKVNVVLDSAGYYFGIGRSPLRAFRLAEEDEVNDNA